MRATSRSPSPARCRTANHAPPPSQTAGSRLARPPTHTIATKWPGRAFQGTAPTTVTGADSVPATTERTSSRATPLGKRTPNLSMPFRPLISAAKARFPSGPSTRRSESGSERATPSDAADPTGANTAATTRTQPAPRRRTAEQERRTRLNMAHLHDPIILDQGSSCTRQPHAEMSLAAPGLASGRRSRHAGGLPVEPRRSTALADEPRSKAGEAVPGCARIAQTDPCLASVPVRSRHKWSR